MQFAKAHIARKIFLYLYEVIAKARVARKIFFNWVWHSTSNACIAKDITF